jgi:hypothetical protein
VVKDGRPAPFLYQQGIDTDQAYNDYPHDFRTGKSLYAFNSYGANTISGNTSAVKVSFDRPMADSGLGNFISWEINLLRWLERSGYDVTYTTDVDTHANGGELLRHKAFLSTGHDEYWSKEMRDAAEAARDSGVNLAFFGGNASYTQVRFEPSAAGVPNRVVVEYRTELFNPIDPVQGPTTTTNYRDPPLNRPEQTLMGIQFIASMANTDYVVANSSHWVYAGTGFKDGDVVRGIVGYEADAFMPGFPPANTTNQTLLSQSPFTDSGGVTKFANSSIYQAPSGAWVFAAGTMSWSWALDDLPGLNHFLVDSRIQQATTNVMNAFLNGAPPTIAGFTPASGAVGASVTISGTDFTGATAVAFNGSAATSFAVTSPSVIQADVPAGATTGPVSVTTPGGTAISATNFTIAPAIKSFTPTGGAVGASVTVSGTSFTGATAVAFNGTAASFSVSSDTAIRATVPTGATTGPVSVTTPGGTATSATNFTVAPTIASFTPTSGAVGASVTISGTSFTGVTAVAFNGSAASFSLTSDTAIQATVPAGATTGPLSVTTPGGTAISANPFTVAPTITSFTPASGPVGTVVTISGTNFTGAATVRFNGVSASTVTVTSATAIQATVPTGATTGPLSVTTAGGTGTSTNNFTVTVALTVSKSSGLLGLGKGTVTSSPSGISCGATCSAHYSMGTVVTLTATPDFLSLFNGWSGCDTTAGTSCTVSISRARTVVARFEP